MHIRAEQPVDINANRAVLVDSFGGQEEADLVDALRADGDLEYSFIAELANADSDGDFVVGQLALSILKAPLKALSLAPVGVIPSERNIGMGSALINASLTEAAADGFEIVFVLGNPDYYSRFGFSLKEAEPFTSIYSGSHFMALWLGEARMPPAELIYPRAFADLD